VLNTPYIILVHPQLHENMGMVARAMLNCGLEKLRLVHPRDDHLSRQALAASSGADHVLRHAQVFKNIKDACEDLNLLIATTARSRDLSLPVYDLDESIKKGLVCLKEKGEVGLLFGGEKSGLSNEDISLVDFILEIPTNPQFSSLNLSQAVLLVGHAYFMNFPIKLQDDVDCSSLASKDELYNFFDRLEKSLAETSFFKVPEKKSKMMHNLRSIFQKAQLSSQEIQMLHGVIKVLRKL